MKFQVENIIYDWTIGLVYYYYYYAYGWSSSLSFYWIVDRFHNIFHRLLFACKRHQPTNQPANGSSSIILLNYYTMTSLNEWIWIWFCGCFFFFVLLNQNLLCIKNGAHRSKCENIYNYLWINDFCYSFLRNCHYP